MQPAQHYPEPTVGALVFEPEGRLFLMRSHKWGGKYVVPGGHVELGETLEAAMKRTQAVVLLYYRPACRAGIIPPCQRPCPP